MRMAPYNKGDVVLRCRPYVVGVTCFRPRNQTRICCFTCFRVMHSTMLSESPADMHRCAACKQAAYCSRECQRLDWKETHRYECPYLVRLQKRRDMLDGAGELTLTSEARLLARLVLRIGRAMDAKKRSSDDAADLKEIDLAERFFKLAVGSGGEEPWRFRWREVLEKRARQARIYLAGHEYMKTLSDDTLMGMEYRRNLHAPKMWLYQVSAAVVSVEICELEHSCDPNCSAVFREDGYVYLIANRRVESDADIRISFINDLLPRRHR